MRRRSRVMPYDVWDRHDPTKGVGAPPARSALGLRFALAVFGFVTCSVIAVVAIVVSSNELVAGVAAAAAAIAVVDAFVVVRRMRWER